jgi:hypothetical protein
LHADVEHRERPRGSESRSAQEANVDIDFLRCLRTRLERFAFISVTFASAQMPHAKEKSNTFALTRDLLFFARAKKSRQKKALFPDKANLEIDC